mmetsp:Transcript_66042/g.137610  ORF Transcript_66042/g.137610 Transcript_66042/m.137610 type:complete len:228 (-) Transcript_66042:572-1255(-)
MPGVAVIGCFGLPCEALDSGGVSSRSTVSCARFVPVSAATCSVKNLATRRAPMALADTVSIASCILYAQYKPRAEQAEETPLSSHFFALASMGSLRRSTCECSTGSRREARMRPASTPTTACAATGALTAATQDSTPVPIPCTICWTCSGSTASAMARIEFIAFIASPYICWASSYFTIALSDIAFANVIFACTSANSFSASSLVFPSVWAPCRSQVFSFWNLAHSF